MTILGMWTADLRDLWFVGNYSLSAISSTQARTGTYSFRNQASYGFSFNLRQTVSSIYFRMAFYSDVSSAHKIAFISPGGITVTDSQCTIRIDTDMIRFYRGNYATLLGTAVVDVPIASWHLIEAHIVISDTVGVAQIKLNNNLIMDLSGQDTKANTTYDTTTKVIVISGGNYIYVDDIMARDDDWCGPGGLYVLTPNAGSTNENWTASAGNPEDCVDELPVSFSDYIYTDAGTPNTEHLFGVTSLPSGGLYIGGVGVFSSALSDFATSGEIRNLIKSGTTTDVGSGVLLETSAQWIMDYWDVNPDDSNPWEEADIDALEIGVETTL